MRAWRRTYPHLVEEKVTRELGDWLREPRTNAEIREHVSGYEGVPHDRYTPVLFARTLLPLVQLPPAGHWDDTGRGARFVLDPRPLRGRLGELVLTRYLEAFGPAASATSPRGRASRRATSPGTAVETVSYRDENGRELLDLPDRPLPPANTPLPPRFLANWDQPLLAYADRDRIIPPEIRPLKLTLSGDPTVTVDGRVAASWTMDDGRIVITPHTDLPRAALRDEALRTARFCRARRAPPRGRVQRLSATRFVPRTTLPSGALTVTRSSARPVRAPGRLELDRGEAGRRVAHGRGARPSGP